MRNRFVAIFLILLLPLALVQAAADGWFGLEVKAEGAGRFWNPIINELIVVSVAPGSPAAKAGIAEGDRIVEVGGQIIAGQRMRTLAPFFEKMVGDLLQLTLVRADGDPFDVTLIGRESPLPP